MLVVVVDGYDSLSPVIEGCMALDWMMRLPMVLGRYEEYSGKQLNLS
jgi:hypothetical protein